jgi:hypothetical protein
MARRVLNRREMRKASDQAETQATSNPDGAAAAPAKKGAKEKPAGQPKVRKTRKKKEPPRLCARWAVFDAAMKQVAVFDYNQRDEADQKIADLTAKKKAPYFLQLIKEPMAAPQTEE